MGGLSGNDVYGDMWVVEPIRQNEILDNTPPISSANDNYELSYIASAIENFQNVPSPRTGHASVLIGNAFIIFGGDTAIDDEQCLDNNLYFFNISSLKWTIASPEGLKPCGRYGTQISVLNFEIRPNFWSSQLFLFGGQLNNEYFNDLWKFDLSNFRNPDNQWTRIVPTGDVPPPLTNHTMTAYNQYLFVFGGQNNILINDKLYCYNSLENQWSICQLKGPSYLPALYSHSAAIYGSLLFIYGGKMSNESISGDFFIINLLNFHCWKLHPNLTYSPGPRFGHSITVNPVDEKILIMGGNVYDNDFTGIGDTSIDLIDEAKFSLPSSVLYVCDIKEIENFIDKSPIENKAEDNHSNSNSMMTKSPSNFATAMKNHSKSKSNIDLTETPVETFVSSTPLELSDIDNDQDPAVIINENLQNYETSTGRAQPNDACISTIDDTFNNDEIDKVLEPNTIVAKPENSSNFDTKAVLVSPIKRDNEETVTSGEAAVTTATTTPKSDVIYDSTLYKTPENQPVRATKSKAPANLLIKKLTSDSLEAPPTISTPTIEQQSILPFSPAVAEKDNIKIQRLVQMVSDIKTEMMKSVQNANCQIVKLESEKKELMEKLNGKDNNLLESDSSENGTATNIDESGVGDESTLKLKTFIKEELSTIPDLNRLIKEQEDKLQIMSRKLHGEEPLHDKIFELEGENMSLKKKLENYSIIHGSCEPTTGGGSLEDLNGYYDNSKSIDDINRKLNVLVSKWNVDGPHTSNAEYVDEINKLKQENAELSNKLAESNNVVKNYELLFSESKESLNKSFQALSLSQVESNKLRNQLNSAMKELSDLKMKKRVYSNSSSRIPSSSRISSASATPNLKENPHFEEGKDSSHETNTPNQIDNQEAQNIEEDMEEDNNVSLVDERYEIKIKDLEANLYIVSQERDQTREELIKLKKELYNARNGSAAFGQTPNHSFS